MVDCCLCCIPVRIGTIILAAVSLFFAISGASAYLGKPEAISPGMPHGLSTLFGILFVIMALISVFGLIGSCLSSPGAVKIFAWMLWGFVLAYFIISAATAYTSFKNKQFAIDKCVADYKGELDKTQEDINQTNADKVIVSDITNSTTGTVNDKIAEQFPEFCSKRENVRIWVTIGVSLILTFLAAYFAGVSSRTAEELKTRKIHDSRSIPSSNNSSTVIFPSSEKVHPTDRKV